MMPNGCPFPLMLRLLGTQIGPMLKMLPFTASLLITALSSAAPQRPVLWDNVPAIEFTAYDGAQMPLAMLRRGEQAAFEFPVEHYHRGSGGFCKGLLYFSKDRISYEPTYDPKFKQDAFDIARSELANEAEVKPGYEGMIRIRLRQRSYDFDLLYRRGTKFARYSMFGEVKRESTDREVAQWLQLVLANFDKAEQEFQRLTMNLIVPLSAEEVAALERQEKDGDAAERLGHIKEAFDLYCTALTALPGQAPPNTDQSVREHVIRLYLSLNPAPALPEDARHHANFAQTALEMAKNQPEQLDNAIREWNAALRIAPWWPEANFNLGLLLEKRERYADASRFLRLYLLAAPKATDKDAVLQRLDSLDYKAKAMQQVQ